MSGVRVPAPPPPSRRIRLRRIEPILRRALTGTCRLPRGRRILVALSGGADSVALLIGLLHVAHEFGLEISAAHLHHGLRGRDADRDLAFVRALCRRRAVPLVAKRIDGRDEMRRRGLSGEGGLRILRREFLTEAAARTGAVAIATAHQANDQLETLLMRLARGTGLRGMGGIRPRRGLWIRPLLEATRSEIEADLRVAGQAWREDGSNRDHAHLRNRIRHVAIPALVEAAAFPRRGTVDGLARNAVRATREARAAERLLGRRAERVLSRALSIQRGSFALDRGVLAAYPSPLRRMVLRRLWTRLVPLDPGLTHSQLMAIQRLLRPSRGVSGVRLPGGWTAGSNRGTIVFRRGRDGDPEPRGTVAGSHPIAVRRASKQHHRP